MKNTIRILGIIAIIALAFSALFLTSCDNNSDNHTHDFSGAWKSNATQHWKECADDGEKAQTANHTPADGVCTVCGYDNTHSHDFTGAWHKDATQHWKECPTDNTKDQIANHDFTGDICDTCLYDKSEPPNTYTVTFVIADKPNTILNNVEHGTLFNTLEIPSTSREGHTFTSWTPTLPETVIATATYTAGYSVNSYQITFDSKGGSAIDGSPFTKNYGETISKPDDPTLDEKVFVKWQLNGVDVVFPMTVTATVTLDAVWKDPAVPMFWWGNFIPTGSTTLANGNTRPFNLDDLIEFRDVEREFKGAGPNVNTVWETENKFSKVAVKQTQTINYPECYCWPYFIGPKEYGIAIVRDAANTDVSGTWDRFDATIDGVDYYVYVVKDRVTIRCPVTMSFDYSN